MTKKNPTFTVVTVCYNAEKLISETIESVKQQTLHDYEYILMDGGSTDSTLSIAEANKNDFLNLGINFIVVSEKDSGIYNAMNKAIKMAAGEWIIFMNCGDLFYSNNILEIVREQLKNNACDILIGDIVIKNNDLYKYKKAKFIDLHHEIDICHQSTFTKTALLKERNYAEKYKLAADREFFCHVVASGGKVFVWHMPLAIYLEGGASAGAKGHKEILDINDKYGVPYEYIELTSAEENGLSLIKKIKIKLHKYIPTTILEHHHRRKMLKNGWKLEPPRKDLSNDREY